VSDIVPTPPDPDFGQWAFRTDGPIGLAGAPAPSGGVSMGHRGSSSGDRWAVKALWFAEPAFDQAVSVTGRRIDGGDESVAFPQRGNVVSTLQIPAGWSATDAHGYHTSPSAVLVTAAGCYQLTVSGPSSTSRITIRVVLADS
jgi:hypothetical protein